MNIFTVIIPRALYTLLEHHKGPRNIVLFNPYFVVKDLKEKILK